MKKPGTRKKIKKNKKIPGPASHPSIPAAFVPIPVAPPPDNSPNPLSPDGPGGHEKGRAETQKTP